MLIQKILTAIACLALACSAAAGPSQDRSPGERGSGGTTASKGGKFDIEKSLPTPSRRDPSPFDRHQPITPTRTEGKLNVRDGHLGADLPGGMRLEGMSVPNGGGVQVRIPADVGFERTRVRTMD